jgi:hypothetical protein
MNISEPVVGFLTSATHDLVARHSLPVTGLKVIRCTNWQAVNNSTTLVNDNEIAFNAIAGANYLIMLYLRIHATVSTCNWKDDWATPSGNGIGVGIDDFTPLAINNVPSERAFFTDHLITLGDSNIHVLIEFAELQIGATPGTVHFQWAQQTAQPNDLRRESGSFALIFDMGT